MWTPYHTPYPIHPTWLLCVICGTTKSHWPSPTKWCKVLPRVHHFPWFNPILEASMGQKLGTHRHRPYAMYSTEKDQSICGPQKSPASNTFTERLWSRSRSSLRLLRSWPCWPTAHGPDTCRNNHRRVAAVEDHPRNHGWTYRAYRVLWINKWITTFGDLWIYWSGLRTTSYILE